MSNDIGDVFQQASDAAQPQKADAKTQRCVCMECRIRAALSPDGNPTGDFSVNIGETITALGNVLSELLAYQSSKSAKHFVAELLVARKKWLKHPRVAVQHPAGNA
jgi:hypothetical protein